MKRPIFLLVVSFAVLCQMPSSAVARPVSGDVRAGAARNGRQTILLPDRRLNKSFRNRAVHYPPPAAKRSGHKPVG